MTGRDLITASLRLIGALAPGESLEASEATDGLASLNRMIDSWSTESLLIYAKVREEFTLTPGTHIYAMGPGAAFNTTRPQRIEAAGVEIGSTEYPVRILTLQEWASITDKTLTSERPTGIYPQGTYPAETLNLSPIPSAANKLVLYSWKPLTSIATLDTSLSLPSGYEEALIYNFALRLAPEYGRAVPDAVVMVAQDSKGNIKRMNSKPRYLHCEAALLGVRGRASIFTGGTA